MASCWDEGGEPDTIMVGSTIKQAMSGIVNGGAAGAAQRVVTGDSATVHTAIDIYVSDFGSLAVVPNRFQVQEFNACFTNGYVLFGYIGRLPRNSTC